MHWKQQKRRAVILVSNLQSQYLHNLKTQNNVAPDNYFNRYRMKK